MFVTEPNASVVNVCGVPAVQGYPVVWPLTVFRNVRFTREWKCTL